MPVPSKPRAVFERAKQPKSTVIEANAVVANEYGESSIGNAYFDAGIRAVLKFPGVLKFPSLPARGQGPRTHGYLPMTTSLCGPVPLV